MDPNSQENINPSENTTLSQENHIITTIPPISENPQKLQEAITQEIDTLTAGFLDGSLNYDEYLSKIVDLDQMDSAHSASLDLWNVLSRKDIVDRILSSQPISKPMQMEDGTTEQIAVDPKEQYYVTLGLEYFHVMQALAISQGNPQAAKEFLFKDPEVIKQIREYTLSEAGKDYLDGTLAYWQGDTEALQTVLSTMPEHLGESAIEKEMNGLNLDVIKRLHDGLKNRGTVDYASDYAGVKESPKVV